VIALFLRILLASLLGYTGVTKLPAAWTFAEMIANYQIFPAQANQLAAVVVPWCEVLCGILLLCGVWIRPAAMVSALLFAGFAVAVSSALGRGLDIECGCFGTETASKGQAVALAIDLLGLSLSLILTWLSTRSVIIKTSSTLMSHTAG
jgi:uncharacterized membrane protein YphA (DoxX/SURF4 family)